MESNTLNITDTFTIYQNSRVPDQIHFLRGIKYRLTVQTDAKWFSGTSENIIVELIGSNGATDEILLENRGQLAQTNQKDAFDVSHEGKAQVSNIKYILLTKNRYWRYHRCQTSTILQA